MKGVYNEDASDKVASDNFGSILLHVKVPEFYIYMYSNNTAFALVCTLFWRKTRLK